MPHNIGRIYIMLFASLLMLSTVTAVRLQISDKECFQKNIPDKAKVTLTVVSDELHGKPVYFDVMARDPRSEVIFSKLEQHDAELKFMNRVAGVHKICIRLSNKSRTNAHSISSPRVKKHTRTVSVDVQISGQRVVKHDRALGEDIHDVMDDVADVQLRIQRVVSTVVHMKMTEANNRDALLMKNRAVTFYSVGKLVVLLALFAVQPVVVHLWFKKHQI